LVGTLETLTEETRQQYEEWISDDQILLKQAQYELNHRAELEEASKAQSDEEKIDAWLGGPLPPIQIYRAPYDVEDSDIVENAFSPEEWTALRAEADIIREKYAKALKTGQIDNRSPLEPARAAWFRKRVERFDPADYPENVPAVFEAAQCNVFGHVCPVFFAAEASTETSTERRRGRYIRFDVKMRVVIPAARTDDSWGFPNR